MCGSPRLCRRRERSLIGARFGRWREEIFGRARCLTLRYSLLLSVWVDPSAEHIYLSVCIIFTRGLSAFRRLVCAFAPIRSAHVYFVQRRAAVYPCISSLRTSLDRVQKPVSINQSKVLTKPHTGKKKPHASTTTENPVSLCGRTCALCADAEGGRETLG